MTLTLLVNRNAAQTEKQSPTFLTLVPCVLLGMPPGGVDTHKKSEEAWDETEECLLRIVAFFLGLIGLFPSHPACTPNSLAQPKKQLSERQVLRQ